MSDEATTLSGSLGALAGTFVLLLLLAALSFGLSYLPLGAWELPLALVIAALKAALVLAVFMELRVSGFLPRLLVLVMIVWLCLLMSFMVLDVLTRQGSGVRVPEAAAPAAWNVGGLR